MPLCRSMVLLLLTVLTATLQVGCQSPPPKTAPAPAPVMATPEQAGMVQADLLKIRPGSRVGHVASINAHQAAVSGMSLEGISVGDSLQFTDANSMGIANGTVFSKDTTTSSDFSFLIVDFEPLPGGRAPVKGDLAIYIPRH